MLRETTSHPTVMRVTAESSCIIQDTQVTPKKTFAHDLWFFSGEHQQMHVQRIWMQARLSFVLSIDAKATVNLRGNVERRNVQ